MENGLSCQEKSDVFETFLRSNRFFVRVKYDDGRVSTMPRANYMWLKNNPSFSTIPPSYVVHHLDWDQTNDDPSNLVIMQKYHHSAYHWKNKIKEIPINTYSESVDITGLKTLPRVKKRCGTYYLLFHANGKPYSVWRDFDGNRLLTPESAEVLAREVFEKGYYIKNWTHNTHLKK